MALAALLAALAVSAAPPARGDEPTPIEVAVGEKLALCASGLVACPVSSFICDDPRVAVVEHGADGAVLKGISPGETLCSVMGYQTAFRRLLRVHVKKARG